MKRFTFIISAPMLLCSLSFAGCTIADRVETALITKATVNFNYDLSKMPTQKLDNAVVYIFDSRGQLFRTDRFEDVAANDIDKQVVTYLPDETYTIVSWLNASERTTLPNVVVGTDIEDCMVFNGNSSGCDDLLYCYATVKVRKGDHHNLSFCTFKSVYKINVSISGAEEACGDTGECSFRLHTLGSLSFLNKPFGEMRTYSPALGDRGGVLSGSCFVPKLSVDVDTRIEVVSPTKGVLYEASLRDPLASAQIEQGQAVELNIQIDLVTLDCSVEITAWEEGTEEKETL